MPKEIIKILGQVRPPANTEVVLYSVPKLRRSIVKVTVFNNSTVSGADINIAIVPNGLDDIITNPTNPENFLVQSLTVGSKSVESGGAFAGITISENDDIRVESNEANTIFHCYGVEIEP